MGRIQNTIAIPIYRVLLYPVIYVTGHGKRWDFMKISFLGIFDIRWDVADSTIKCRTVLLIIIIQKSLVSYRVHKWLVGVN